MNDAFSKVLLVEEDPAYAKLVQEALAKTLSGRFEVEWVSCIRAALERLERDAADVVLLDLRLPDGQGVEAFDRVFQAAGDAVVLVLCAAGDEESAHQAIQHGAYDYLDKAHVDAHWLPRTLRYFIEHKASKDALLNSEARFRAMNDASPLGIFVSDVAGNCVYTNAAYQNISGLTFEQAQGTQWPMAVHPDDRQRVIDEWSAAAGRQEPFHAEFRFLRQDGSIVWARLNAAAINDGRKLRGHVQMVEDITERISTDSMLRAAEETLFEEKERAQVTLNSIGDAVLTADLNGNVTYLNTVAEEMTGWSHEDAVGRPLTEVFRIIDGTTREVAANPAQLAIDEDKTVGLSADCVLIRRDGVESSIEDSSAPIHNREGRVIGTVLVFHDVSESKAVARKMMHLAQHDFLTGLPNRVLLMERLSLAMALAQRHRKQVAVLFLDLDYFKHINDSLGHAIGDQLLKLVAQRLLSCVRGTDTVCRQGGDEFVILLAEIERPQDAAQVAEMLCAALVVPHMIGGHELHVTLSIGISIYPDDGDNVDALLQNADTAMYHAKASGRNNYQFFRDEMNTRAVRRQFVEASLRRALRQGEFRLYYQPKIDLLSGRMSGTEALIRWVDPQLGVVYPDQFVSIAEECGLIVPIGRWVLREACRQVQSWLDSGLSAVPVAVNISSVEFRHESFLENVATILKETGLAPCYLELEMTESLLMNDAESSASVLEALKSMGVQLAVDDFGTGYSSLSYLKRFPIDTLKIDQSFVRDIATDIGDGIIVSAVIGMGRNLKQRVIAEGVETQEQLAFLLTQKCDEAQGFQFSRPLPAEDFARLFLAGNDELPRQWLN